MDGLGPDLDSASASAIIIILNYSGFPVFVK